MEVQVVSRKFINPSSPTPPDRQCVKVSGIDQLPPPVYFGFIFYYPATSQPDYSERSKLLEKSLSEILTRFYPLAGRYFEKDLLIDCKDQRVEYLEARVSSDLSQVLDGKLPAEQLNHFVPSVIASPTSPLLAIQINTFKCGGTVIGIRILHRIADGFTGISFANEWAKTTRVGTEKEKVRTPCFCLAPLFPAREVPGNMHLQNIGVKIATKSFVFSKTAMSDLKEIAKAGAANSGRLEFGQPSRVDVVTGLIWRSLIKVGKAKHGYLRPSLLAHGMDMRGKTSLPIPDSCCGNMIRAAIARFLPEDTEMGLHDLVGLVRDAIQNAVSDCREATSYDDLLSGVCSSFREIGEEMKKGEMDVYVFSSWCRFPSYEVDFGWGKPAWVSGVHKSVQAMNLMDGKDDGIEAWLSLEERDMLLLQQDPVIISFATSSIFVR